MKKSTAVKYLALDVHQATSVYEAQLESGKRLEEGVVETDGKSLVALARRLGPNLHITFEEGTQAEWLYDLFIAQGAKVTVCDSRAAAEKKRSKSDRLDAAALVDLLRKGMLKPVYHKSRPVRALREYVRAYTTLVLDTTRIMLRIKAIYRGRLIRAAGDGVYRPALRREWLDKINEPAARARCEWYLTALDRLSPLRKKAKSAMLAEAKKHPAWHLLQSIPGVGPVRAAELVAILITPHRFRSKRKLWSYAGLAVVTHSTSDFELTERGIRRKDRRPMTRGLNRNSNRILKKIFKSCASEIARGDSPLGRQHRARLARGIRPEMSILTLARKVAAIILAVWKTGVPYDANRLTADVS